VDDEKYGVGLILSPDSDPLLNSANVYEALFRNAASTLNPQPRSGFPLPYFSLNQ
jgi:hypothetical protein